MQSAIQTRGFRGSSPHLARRPHSKRRGYQDRFDQLRFWKGKLVKTLEQTSFSDRAADVRFCHQLYSGQMDCREHLHAVATPIFNCSVPLCPFRMLDRERRLQREIGPALARLIRTGRGKWLVLSEANSLLDFMAGGRVSLWASFRRFRRWLQKRDEVVSAALLVIEEETFNYQEITWNIHLNVVFEAGDIPHSVLVEGWRRATRDKGRTAYIRRLKPGSEHELLKYTAKLASFVSHPGAVEEYLGVTKGKQLIRRYGWFRGFGSKQDQDQREDTSPQESSAEQDEDQHVESLPRESGCPDCGKSEAIALPRLFRFEEIVFDDRLGALISPQVLELIVCARGPPSQRCAVKNTLVCNSSARLSEKGRGEFWAG